MSFKKKLSGSIKGGIVSLFNTLGIDAHLARKGKEFDRVLFDRNLLSYYYNRHQRLRLYYESIKKAGVEWSDNFSKQCRYNSMQQVLRSVLAKGLEGHCAECGVWQGHSAYMIAIILSESTFKETFHIFDSFEGGLSEKGQYDKNDRFDLSNEEIRKEKLIFASSEDEVRKTLSAFDFIKLYKGWIPHRFSEVDHFKYIFVHLDVDLYQPTLDSLKFFYPRLVEGGAISIDDYGCTQFSGCAKAVDEYLDKVNCSFFYEVPTGGAFLIK